MYSDYKPLGPWKDVDYAMQGIAAIRDWIKHNIDEEISKKTRIIYGGDVTAETAEEYMKRHGCDGFLLTDEVSREEQFSSIVKTVSDYQINKVDQGDKVPESSQNLM